MAIAALFSAALLAGTGCALIPQLRGLAERPPDTSPAPPAPPASNLRGELPPIAAVAAEARPAVVFISTRENAGVDIFRRSIVEEGVGSGVLFDPRGYIITNAHVVAGASSLKVTLPDGRTFEDVTLVGGDRLTDVAVIKVEGRDLPSLRLGDSEQLKIGDWVLAIGNALGLEGGPTVTAGVVSALGRSISEPGRSANDPGVNLEDLIQTDAAISRGNSGGPLVDLSGRVVGINTAIDTRGQAIGFAISINSARPVIDQLVRSGRVVRGYLGVQLLSLTPAIASQLRLRAREGVLIATLVRGTPAAEAGLQPGDVITALDGKSMRRVGQVLAMLLEKRPGERLEVEYNRGGSTSKTTVTLGEAPRQG